MRIDPAEVRFIKLGKGGEWEQECIEGPSQSIRLGFDNPLHQACIDSDWQTVEAYWKKTKPTEATKIVIDYRPSTSKGIG